MYNIAQLLIDQNQTRSNKVAYRDDQLVITYGQLSVQVMQMAQWLTEHGVQPGDRVAIVAYDRIHTVIAFLATVWTGGIAVMINPRGRTQSLQYQISHVTPMVVLTEAELVDQIKDISTSAVHNIDLAKYESWLMRGHDCAVVTQATDTAFMLWTSGTTGHSKAVMHSHVNAYTQCVSSGVKTLGITDQDRVYATAKLFFAFGIISSLFDVMWTGAECLLDSGMAIPARVRRNIEEYQPTVFFSVPVIYAQLSSRAIEIHARCVSAGDRLPQPVIDKWQATTGQTIHNCLGTTECLTAFAFNHTGGTGIGSAIPGYQLRVVDDAGHKVPAGQVGRLEVQAPSRGLGYWNDPEWTAKTFGDWMATGDSGMQDQQGNYHHMGRSADTIKIAGQFVNPGEIEEVLQAHPAVEQAAVISKADDLGIEHIEAYVVPVPNVGCNVHELRQWLINRKERWACPRIIHLVTELPRTDSGKIQRYRLRESSLTH